MSCRLPCQRLLFAGAVPAHAGVPVVVFYDIGQLLHCAGRATPPGGGSTPGAGGPATGPPAPKVTHYGEVVALALQLGVSIEAKWPDSSAELTAPSPAREQVFYSSAHGMRVETVIQGETESFANKSVDCCLRRC